ncbi:protein-L-isoaspartate O-methyltransferase family protein [Roseovarius salinarum]|uniref:protein-L-isoaspartate O-methyltransferase family protein n=1 Tax=Roseovarius salinarum TaxID=1981892 RepID=UPI000C31FBF6|nr:protein-L-isoaspartate O-methyltransferase [Roseovarius salinarum]
MPDYTARRTQMVDTQVRPAEVTKFPIIDAMLAVPREVFVPRSMREAAYMDGNIDLGGNRVVLAPRTLAKMLDALDIRGDELVLDVGCALGYSSAVMARMAEAVVGVEQDSDMAAEAQGLLADNDADNVVVHQGPLTEGAAKHGPYDVIVVEGAVEDLPDALTGQLKEGGRIACLFAQDRHLGAVRIGYLFDGHISWRFAFNADAPVLPGFERRKVFAL